MSNQYFENNENLESNRREISFYFKGKMINLTTDNGVFSKDGVDFGSTLLLKAVDVSNKKSLLDVGCGYGVIGITLGLLNKEMAVTMVDVNYRAMDLAKANAIKNGLTDVKVLESFAYQNINDSYDLIVSNPPIRAGKAVVHEILEQSYNHLNEGGEFYTVIQKKQGAESAYKKLLMVYNNAEKVLKDGGFWVIKCVKH